MFSPLAKGLFSYSGHGVQDHGSRAIGNWWSDHATDLMAPGHSQVFAPEPLTIGSVTRRASTGSGVNDGSSVFATGASGEHYAFLHLDPAWLPVPGQRINAGAPWARIADGTAGGPHLHFATQSSDPDAFVKSALADGGSGGGAIAGIIAGAKGALPSTGQAVAANPALGVAVGAARAAGSAGDVLDTVTAVPKFLGRLTDPHYILRGLQLVAGAVLVLVGVVLLARQVALANDLPDPVQAGYDALPAGRLAKVAAATPKARPANLHRTTRVRPLDQPAPRQRRARVASGGDDIPF